MAQIQPILLIDTDGLRLVSKGHIGPYQMVSLHNPELIAQAVGERRRRNLIQETNQRHWS